jgi:eukaryotic-like serine/threonine-protein kinase
LTLKAKASKGSAFVGWSGPCTGRARCKVKVTGHLLVTAKFAAKNCVVPNVKGKSLSAARKALQAHSCSVGRVTHAPSNKVAAGSVISESPQAGTHLRHNGKVRLTVSFGKKP